MEVAEFREHHFRHVIQGARAAYSGNREDYASSLEFWVWSLHRFERSYNRVDVSQHRRIVNELAEESLCESIDDCSFWEPIEYTVSALKRAAPDFLLRRNTFLGGTKVFDDLMCDYVRLSLVGEFPDCFIAYHLRLAT